MTAFTYTKDQPLVLVGAGNMGGSMARGWLKAGLNEDALILIDPSKLESPDFGAARKFASASNVGAVTAKTLVIAVKPQMMAEVLPTLRVLKDADTLVVSVAAGTSLDQFLIELGEGPMVRAMPNTPAAVGKGISGLVANILCSDQHKAEAEKLVAAVGKVIWVENEALINAVTATSGSGPAYVFYLVECLAAAAVANGLDEGDAIKLARETIIGAAHLMESTEEDPQELRRHVTSPNGTTAAALDVLMAEDGLQRLMRRSVRAARKRAEELAAE